MMRVSSKLQHRRLRARLVVFVTTLIALSLLWAISRQLVSVFDLRSAPYTQTTNVEQAAPPPTDVAPPPSPPPVFESFSDVGSLPECAKSGTRSESWLMVFMGHSGSSAVHSQLRQHPDVMSTFDPEAVDHHQYEFNTTLALQFTRNLFEEARAKGKTAGYKIRPNHILAEPKEWAELAAKYNTRIIWNYRENTFKKAVGEYKMLYYNDKTVVEGLHKRLNRSELCKLTKCTFPIKDMDKFHFQLRRMSTNERLVTRGVKLIDNGRGCVLPLPYERYLHSPQAVMKKVHAFLGIDYINNAPLRFKSTRDNLCELIENWDEVCHNFFHCIPWRPMMVDRRYNCGCNVKPGPDKYCQLHNYK